MAVKKNSYLKGPWALKKNEINDFSLVTEINRKNAIVQGRILYVIQREGRAPVYCGFFTIDPCFTKGWWKVPCKPFEKKDEAHRRTFIHEDIVRAKWASEYKSLLDLHIKNEQLFIKSTDPILTYHKE